VRKQDKATKKTEVEREIPDWPEIPADVIARFPSLADYQRRQLQAWHTVKLLLRELIS
jgi:hypothetical protein